MSPDIAWKRVPTGIALTPLSEAGWVFLYNRVDNQLDRNGTTTVSLARFARARAEIESREKSAVEITDDGTFVAHMSRGLFGRLEMVESLENAA